MTDAQRPPLPPLHQRLLPKRCGLLKMAGIAGTRERSPWRTRLKVNGVTAPSSSIDIAQISEITEVVSADTF